MDDIFDDLSNVTNGLFIFAGDLVGDVGDIIGLP